MAVSPFAAMQEPTHTLRTSQLETILGPTLDPISATKADSTSNTFNISIERRSTQQGPSDADRRKQAEDIVRWLGVGETSAPPKTRPARGTLTWFFVHPIYQDWLSTPASATVLQGNVGCGKTTLVHKIGETLHRSVANTSDHVITFFCGTSRSPGTCLENLLRTVLISSSTLSALPIAIRSLFDRHNAYLTPQQPSLDDLEITTTEVLSTGESETFLLLDALDEVPDSERVEVIEFLLHLASRCIPSLHILLVNRPGAFLRRFQASKCWKVETIPKEEVRNDIVRFVENEVHSYDNLDALEPELQTMILHRLAGDDNDQFRWAKLQLDRLSHLQLSTPDAVKFALKTLPRDLYETYERSLVELEKNDGDHDGVAVECARNALRLLAFASQPLYIEEFIDGVATSFLDIESLGRCQITPMDLLRLLPGMVQISPEPDWTSLSSLPTNTHFVSFEHFSVKEYITSSHIRESAASKFAFEDRLAHRHIADTCIFYVYWTFVQSSLIVSRIALKQHKPFIEYAWVYWSHHLNQSIELQGPSEATSAESILHQRKVDISATLATVLCQRRHLLTDGLYDTFALAATSPFFLHANNEPEADIALSPEPHPMYYPVASNYLRYGVSSNTTYDANALSVDRHAAYHPLSSKQIRLLNVATARFPASPLWATFVNVEPDETCDYMALSYVWGWERSAQIFVDGMRRIIPDSLGRFLRAISQSRKYHKHCVWADAICIDQSNLPERESQIILMPLIFRAATELVIGLGERPSQGEQRLLDALRSIQPKDVFNARERDAGRPNTHLPLLDLTSLYGDVLHDPAGTIFAVLQLLSRNWFSRLWIVPERINGRKITYFFDNGSAIASQDIGLLFDDTVSICTLLGASPHEIQLLRSRTPFARASCIHDLALLLRCGASLNAYRLLYATRLHMCYDSRDRFYALYSIVSASLPPQDIDYSTEITSIAVKFIYHISESYGILGLLTEASYTARDHHAPTWVSTASSLDPEQFVSLVFKNGYTVDETDFNAGARHPRKLTLVSDRIIQTPGVLLGTIRVVLDPHLIASQQYFPPEVVASYCVGRSLARFIDGDQTALVPNRAQLGDQIFVFPGCRVPYVLRRHDETLEQDQGSTNSLYTYVGESYVPGCMHGEALACVDDVAALPFIGIV